VDYAFVNQVLISRVLKVLDSKKQRSVRYVEVQVHPELSSLRKRDAYFDDRAVPKAVRTAVRTATHLLKSYKKVREEHQ